MNNSLTIILVAVLLLGNGAIAALRLNVENQTEIDISAIATLESSNTALDNGIDALAAEQAQAAAALAALQVTASQLGNGASSAITAKYGPLIAAVDPVVVRLTAPGPGLRGYNSGVIISSNGYVLTVLHAVNGANSITVTLNTGEEFAATMVAFDTTANLALLKMTTPRTNFPTADLGSMNILLAGQAVMAAAYPLTPEIPGPATFTAGVVSSLRTAADFHFIQSDASIAPGSGGGGLFTMDGKLVGLASLAEADGIYLFVPVDDAASLLTNIP
jgi:serine protease Do